MKMMKTNKLILLIALFLFAYSADAHKRLNLEYVQNSGQWHENVLYKVHYGGGAIFLEKGCFTYSFCHPEDRASVHDYSQWPKAQQDAFQIRSHSWKMHFDGALNPLLEGEKVQEHYYNYFLGNDKSKWTSHVGVYEAVKYSNLYDGIDVRTYNRGANFKYDFIVKTGANPSSIQLDFEGLDGVQIIDGKLVLETSIGQFKENEPFAYQIIDGIMVEVACEYQINNELVSFNLPNGYNTNYKLIIDPELIAATLSGTVGEDNYGHTATFDLTGDIYTGAISFGVGYPTTTGAFDEDFNGGGGWGTDIAVSHLTADGTDLIWASYIGGGEGDYPHSLVVSEFQELHVYGSTTADDYPTTTGAYDESHNGGADIVISKFSADGSELVGSTYIGGSEGDGRNAYSVNYGDTYRGEIILDQTGRPMIASFSSSSNFPTSANAYQNSLSGEQDAVICRLNPLLTNLEVSTYLGSSSNDSGYGLRTTSSGNICVAGTAGSADFPTTAGCYQSDFLGGGDEWTGEADGFISVLNSSGSSLLASTLYGTDQQDQIFFIDLDNDENIFVYGQGGTDIPIVGDVYNNANSKQFVSKFDQNLNTVLLSTQIGTGGGDGGTFDFVPIAFLVDHCNNIYVSSHGANSWDGNLPLTPDALYGNGEGSFYLAVLSEDMEDLEFGTMYTSGHVDGGTSRFDKTGTVYQAVCSGGGFATTADAWATDQSTGWDIGVFKINFDVSGVNSSIAGSDVTGCAPFEVTFSNFSVGDQFFWDFGDGTTSTEETPTHIYEDPGLYTVSLIASDSLSCNLADTTYMDIQISTPQDIFPDFTWVTDCETLGIDCTNNTGIEYYDYIWDMGDGTILNDYDASYNYEEPGTYEVSLQAIDNGCEADETISYEVTIYDEVVAEISNGDEAGCAPFEVEFSQSGSGVTFTWDFGDGSPTVNGNNVTHIYETPGSYTVTLSAEGSGDCEGESTTESSVEVTPAPPVTPQFVVEQIEECELLKIQIEDLSAGDDIEYWWDMGDGTNYASEEPNHIYDSPGVYTITLTLTEPICDQIFTYTQEVEVIEAIDLELPPSLTICYYSEGVTLQGAELGADATYLWSTGETTQDIFVTEPGVYELVGTTNNCSGMDAIEVNITPAIAASMDMYACEGTQTVLSVPYAGADYLWCEGETSQTLNANEPGDYCYQFIDDYGCIQEGVIHLTHLAHDADVYIPNAFTPNGDGINDVFVPVAANADFYEFSVWNRWGDIVFETTDPTGVWDGSHQGGEYYVQDGVYTYKVVYNSTCDAEKVEIVGNITVIR